MAFPSHAPTAFLPTALAALIGIASPAPAAEPAAGAPGEPGPLRAYALVKSDKGMVKVSLFSEEQAALVIARVGDETIPLKELTQAIARSHRGRGEGKAGKKKFQGVLDRLVGGRLIAQESRAMGLGDLPEAKKSIADYSAAQLLEILKEQVVSPVQAKPEEVEKAFQDSVREWKTSTVVFADEAAAKQMVADLAAGKAFDEVVLKATGAKNTLQVQKGVWQARKQLQAPALEALLPLSPGQTTGAVALRKGFAVIRCEELRYPPDPAARAEVGEKVLEAAQATALSVFYKETAQKIAKLDEALLKQVDFEAPQPGFEALKTDRRELATFQGAAPVTVGDVARRLEEKSFHGISHDVEKKLLNNRSYDALSFLVKSRVTDSEVKRRKIAESAEYQERVAGFTNRVLFDLFVQKVVLTDLVVPEAEQRSYYEAHKAEFREPGVIRLSSIGFRTKEAATAAFDKLKGGTDFKWLRANASGQLPADSVSLPLDHQIVAAQALPPELAKLLASAKRGDLRLYQQKQPAQDLVEHYLVVVDEVFPTTQHAFTEVAEKIRNRLASEKVGKAIDSWIGKLRSKRKVEVLITKIVS